MGGKIFKEIFIFILLVIVILFTLSMIFYDFFHNTQELPEIKEYIADSNVKATLQEIDANSEERDSSDSLLKSYEIVNADLKNYQSEGSYDKGKAHPFEDYKKRASMEYESDVGSVTDEENSSDKTTTSTNTNKTNSNTTTSKTSNSTNTTSTQGTLFEEPNSK